MSLRTGKILDDLRPTAMTYMYTPRMLLSDELVLIIMYTSTLETAPVNREWKRATKQAQLVLFEDHYRTLDGRRVPWCANKEDQVSLLKRVCTSDAQYDGLVRSLNQVVKKTLTPGQINMVTNGALRKCLDWRQGKT